MKKINKFIAIFAAMMFFTCSIFVCSAEPVTADPTEQNDSTLTEINMEPDGLPDGKFELVTLDDVAEGQPIGNIPGRKRFSKAAADTAKMPLLVIVIGFTDTPYNDSYDWSKTIFSATASDWSLYKYYLDNSQGKFTFAPAQETSKYNNGGNTNTKDAADDGIVHVTVNRKHGNWVDQWRNDDLSDPNLIAWRDTLSEAMTAADNYVDFSMYDADGDGVIETNEMALSFIVAGGEASNTTNRSYTSDNYLTWAHAWGMSAFMDAAPVCDGKKLDRYIALGEDLTYYRYKTYTEGIDQDFYEADFEAYSADWADKAAAISAGDKKTVDLEGIFAFHADKTGKYTFYSEAYEGKDTYPDGRVIDSAGETIASATKGPGKGQASNYFCISFDAEAGKTYYLQARNIPENGPFTVGLSEGVPEEYLYTKQAGVFSLAHELGHYLGLPDFYNTRNRDGAWRNYEVGNISVMASGNWCYVKVDGEEVIRPCALDACSRVALGWVKPVMAEPGETFTVTAQNYGDNSGYDVLMIPTDNEGEYYLVENRQFSGWDEGLATAYPKKDGYTNIGIPYKGSNAETGGLVFWHIDKGILDKYEPINEINTLDHTPGYMPTYMEHNGDKKYKFIGTTVEKRKLFFDEDIYRDHYASTAGETIFLSTYSTTEDTPAARFQSDHDRGITLEGSGASINVTITNGHSLTKTEAVEATCTAPGNTAYWTCSMCGKYFSDEDGEKEIDEDSWVIEKKPHAYGDWTTTKKATCTEKGSKEKVCANCGDKVTEDIAAKGHQWNSAYTVDKAATCTEAGSESIHCSVCDATKDERAISAKGHSWKSEFSVDKEPTCTTEGSKSRHCANCDEKTDVTVIEAKGHTFGEWIEDPPSKCEEAGLRKHTCEVCGVTETEGIDPSGHDWKDEFTVDVPASCTTDGSRSKHCKNCDAVKDSEVIPAFGHSYGDWTTTKPANCTEKGSKEKVCANCKDKVTEEIPALGHAWGEPEWKWKDDHSAATATFTCKNDNSHAESVNAIVTSTVDGSGDKVYTAKVNFEGKEYTTKVEETPQADSERIFGDSRYDTAIKVADKYKGTGKLKNVVVAYGKNFPDALAGGYLAKVKDAPILLVEPKVEDRIANYIKENMESGGTVYLLGGTGVVSSSFENKLKAKGIKTERLGGKDRYDTNLKILQAAGVTNQDILVCTGKDYADSLSASAAGLPILLVGNSLNDAQKSYLKSLSTSRFYLIGGNGAVKPEIETALRNLGYGNIERIAGSTRYETSTAVAKNFRPTTGMVVLAYAKNFPDGLAGGPLAMKRSAPIILTDSNKTAAAKEYVKEAGGKWSITLGGPSLISDEAVKTIMGRNADPANDNNGGNDNPGENEDAPTYTYDIKFINEPYGCNGDNGNFGDAVLYIATDNPNRFDVCIAVFDENGNKTDGNNYYGVQSSNSKYRDWVTLTDGYISVFTPKCTGLSTIVVYETDDEGNMKKAASKKVNIRNYEAEYAAWRQSVINEVTNETMTNKEKLQAICDYILQNYSYTRVDSIERNQYGYLNLISYEGIPVWVDKHVNSASSPAILYRFAQDLNYPVENMYPKYPVGTDEWWEYHMYVYSEADDTYFSACPAKETGYVDPATIVMFDPATYHFWTGE